MKSGRSTKPAPSLQTQPGPLFSKRQDASIRLIGSDPVVEQMQALGMEVSRENYLALAYPSGTPEEGIPPELEAILAALPDLPVGPQPMGSPASNKVGEAESLAFKRHRRKPTTRRGAKPH